MINALPVGPLVKLLREGIELLIERIRLLIENIVISIREDSSNAFRELPVEVFQEAFQELFEYLVENHFIELAFAVLGIFFIGWTLKIWDRDKQ